MSKNSKNSKNPYATPKGEVLRENCPHFKVVSMSEDSRATKEGQMIMLCAKSNTQLDGEERGYNCYHCSHYPVRKSSKT